jgi:excisionase family DNA binding protein
MENPLNDELLEKLKSIEKHILATQKNVLNLDEVSTHTGLSKSHIYKLTSTGGIPCYKQAKHLYFDRVEIESWLKSNKQTTKEEIEIQASTYVALNTKGGVHNG